MLDNVYHRCSNIQLGIAADSASAAEVPFKQADQVFGELQANWTPYFVGVAADEKPHAEKFDQACQAYV